MVLLLLAVIWAAVLIPPMLRARADNRPAGSIVDFRRGLHVLARTGPGSGPSRMMGVDRPGSTSVLGRVHPVSQAYQAYQAYSLEQPQLLHRSPSSRSLAHRRSVKRRRDILMGLMVAMAGSLVGGLLPGLRVLWAVHVVIDLLFAAYVAALVYVRNQAAEREMKLSFLPPPRATRPVEPALLLRRSAN